MRMTEDEYAALISRRAAAIRDTARQLGCPAPKNAERLADDSIPLSSKPVNLRLVQKPRGQTAAPRQAKQPNKTEAEYGKLLGLEFPGALIVFEGFSFRMSNGHRYTPDWVVCKEDLLLCVEVKARGKNGFRHPSYQRARLAFDQCKHDYPAIQWRWAEKFRGTWDF